MPKMNKISDYADVHYKIGMRLFNEGNYQIAIKELQTYIDYESNPALESYLYLGKALFLTDQYFAAIIPLNEFIKKSETSNLPYAYDVLGQCYLALDDIEIAKVCYETATQLDPMCASAWHNWGVLQMTLLEKMALESEEMNHGFLLAIHYYQEALTSCDNNDDIFKKIATSNLAECLAQYGHYLYKLDHYEEALIQYSAAIENDSDHLSALNQAGMCCFKQGHYEDAIAWFALIIERTVNPQEQADAWLNIACSYRLAKNFESALKAINNAKELAPDDASVMIEENNIISGSLGRAGAS